jgi:hypothetical protein
VAVDPESEPLAVPSVPVAPLVWALATARPMALASQTAAVRSDESNWPPRSKAVLLAASPPIVAVPEPTRRFVPRQTGL